MKYGAVALVFACLVAFSPAQEKTDEGPTNEKALKTYNEGLEYLHQRMKGAALDAFKKADKQDGGHCRACQRKMIKYGVELREWKIAETAAEELVEQAQGGKTSRSRIMSLAWC